MDNVKLCGVWESQVELQATSAFFGVPVYVGMLNSTGIYYWHPFKPCTIKIPELESSLSLPIYPFTTKHIEITQNSSRNHYDSAVPIFSGAHLPLQFLHIITQVSTTTIAID